MSERSVLMGYFRVVAHFHCEIGIILALCVATGWSHRMNWNGIVLDMGRLKVLLFFCTAKTSDCTRMRIYRRISGVSGIRGVVAVLFVTQ